MYRGPSFVSSFVLSRSRPFPVPLPHFHVQLRLCWVTGLGLMVPEGQVAGSRDKARSRMPFPGEEVAPGSAPGP